MARRPAPPGATAAEWRGSSHDKDEEEPRIGDHTEHFTKMIRNTMETPAWRALSPVAQALYPWLKLEWHGPDYNNGDIRLWQASERLGVGKDTAAKAFHDLQAKGFLFVTQYALLGIAGAARATTFEITELALPHSDNSEGRKLYRDWRPGADFSVLKVMTNNPRGKNGKTEPRHQLENNPVIEVRPNPAKRSGK